jgi:hypothetical protein
MLTHSTMNNSSIKWKNSPYNTALFRNLIKNNTFKNLFIQRYIELLNTTFSKEITSAKLEKIKNLYAPEISRHISRWHYPSSFSEWENNLENRLLYFLNNRPCSVELNLIHFWGLDSLEFSCIPPVLNTEEDFILVPNPNNGTFYIYNSSNQGIHANILIGNVSGQIVYAQENVTIKEQSKHHFKLLDLANGTYFIKIYAEHFFEAKKFVVAN